MRLVHEISVGGLFFACSHVPLEVWLCSARICFGEVNPELDIGSHRPMATGVFLSL